MPPSGKIIYFFFLITLGVVDLFSRESLAHAHAAMLMFQRSISLLENLLCWSVLIL